MLEPGRFWGVLLAGALVSAPLGAVPAQGPATGATAGRAAAVNRRLGRGVNVIGYDPIWKDRAKARFKQRYFERIREAGFDSVRINLHPFRHMDPASGDSLEPAWLETLDWAVTSALAAQLAVILDMHEFHALAEDPAGRKGAWLAFWKQIAARYSDASGDVVFELLNEPFGKLTPELWNEYLSEGLAVVRATNPTRVVIVGGGCWNSIDGLQTLVLPDDDRNLIATVHYYTPMEFTHQGAPWSAANKDKSGIPWAGTAAELRRIEQDFARAEQWALAHDRPVLLGEFGAYDKADMDSRARYTAAVARTAERLGWSWAYWQFDSDFVVYDVEKDAWVEPIREALVPDSSIPKGYEGSPFGDSRHPKGAQLIPGRLQCELYDVGGPGVAYSDSDAKNSGSGGLNPLDGTYLNGFRADEAVDVSYTKDQGTPAPDFSDFNLVTPEPGSLYVGWTAPGEWVHYTVRVETSGRYSVDVMYTSNGEGSFELSVDGVPRGTLRLPTTHDPADPLAWRQWHHWSRKQAGLELDLTAGLHLVRIRLLAGNTNLDYLELRPASAETEAALRLNGLEYLEMPGLNVMLAHDFYPEGHQGGVGIIHNGQRVATNGDLRLDRTPGQWQPVPKVGKRVVDATTGEISVRAEYPDEAKNRKGFNPVEYPDLSFAYSVRVRPEGKAFRILVDLEQPLPEAWIGKLGFNMEFFPGILFGKTWATETTSGIFPRQPNGPGALDAKGEYQIAALGTGKRLVVAPESDRQRMSIEDVTGGGLELVDGRGQHNNGWFVVRSLVAKGATRGAVEWLVTPHAIPGFVSEPTLQVSQVGYHPKQAKWAIVETDPSDTRRLPVVVSRITAAGDLQAVMEARAEAWGRFLRYDYLRIDFTAIEKPGMYVVSYGEARSSPFRIGADVYQRHAWQPTVDSFLPVQMCHVRVNERYRVWHDACHLDDARMAPVDYNHFDGYLQGPSTLTEYAPGVPVPGLDRGGWHDAGDDDLRVESQADTMYGLALAWESFHPDYDDTSIDQKLRVVEMHQPDGKPDVLQQIEHGALTVVGGYRALGRFYRGIISPTLRQYTQLGDFAAQTDNVVFDPRAAPREPPPVGTGVAGSPDDRWVFTEQNPRRELSAAAGLAASARALRGYDDALADECLAVAKAIWDTTDEAAVPAPPRARSRPSARIGLAVELLLTTKDRRYADYLVGQREAIVKGIQSTGWVVGRALPLVGDESFTRAVTEAVRGYRAEVLELEKKTPYGVPYEPNIWGAGWGIQRFGMQQYFLHAAFADIFPRDAMLHALDFVLGVHPGPNNASFVSGVGSESVLVGYGLNRADWGYIPGGSVSGTALIRPDYPELLEWPYLWQQTEYVLGGGTTDYLFLVLAADHLLNRGE